MNRQPSRVWLTLARLGLILLAYALASAVSGISGTLVMLIRDQLVLYPQVFLSTTGLLHDLMAAAVIGSALSAIFAAPVGLLAIILSEWRVLSRWPFFALAGLAAGLVGWTWFSSSTGIRFWPALPSFVENLYMLPSVIVGGIAGGLIYWLIAGRRAGAFRSGSPAA